MCAVCTLTVCCDHCHDCECRVHTLLQEQKIRVLEGFWRGIFGDLVGVWKGVLRKTMGGKQCKSTHT